MRRLAKLHHSPLITNASMNRTSAESAFRAGLTTQQIAAEWPKVFRVDGDGKLAQIYDSEIDDGSERLETKYTITAESVREAIARHIVKR